MIFFTYSQSTINLAIVDDNDYPTGILNIIVPNLTYCNHHGVLFQIRWINSSTPLGELADELESDEIQTHAFIARTTKSSTKLIQDFCRTNRILFINMISYESTPKSSPYQEYSVMPDVVHILVGYLKYHRVRSAAYIYDNHEATSRIYEFIKLMNIDEYFNNFTLNIRTTRNQDVYSLLYGVEIQFNSIEQPSKYILLDLESYLAYDKMFNKISHMGLTSDLYSYVILSTFDICSWMKHTNFTGRIIFFDYQQRDCIYEYQQAAYPSENTSNQPKFSYHVSYYRSKLTFRGDNDPYKFMNSTHHSSMNSSLFSSNQSNDTDLTFNSCNNPINRNKGHFSYVHFISQLPKSYQLHSRSLFNALNLVLNVFSSNKIDCKTLRLKEIYKKPIKSYVTDIDVYTTKKSNLNIVKQQIELSGRYSSIHDVYRPCLTNKHKDMTKTPIGSASKIYYITGVFDEPFLMLHRRTLVYKTINETDVDLKSLRGHIFDFHELEGFCLDLAVKVCSILNITCKFRIVHDGGFGSKNPSTGTWDGMVGEVVSRIADMAIAPLTISQKRMEVVDFSKPFMNLGISIMIRKPDAEKPGVFSFMNPVSVEIWLCFSLAYFAVSVVLFLTSRVVNSGWRRRVVRRPSYRSYSYPKSLNDRRKSEIHIQRQKRDSMESDRSSELTSSFSSTRQGSRRRHHYRVRHNPPIGGTDRIRGKKAKDDNFKKSDVHLFGISNALFFSFASFMRQSINLVPKSLSGRVAATSWWYFSLIFVSSYTANLVAFLTVEKLVAPIANVEDLAKRHDIKYGSVRNGTTAAFFEKSNVSVFQHMWAVMQRSASEVMVGTNDEGVEKVRNSKGKYAFFIESTKNEYVNERLPCNTMKVGSDLDSKGYGIATRIGSDLTEAINIIVTNLRESGFLEKLRQRWWYEQTQCPQSTKDKRYSELSLSSVTGLFYIFLFGIILSCFIAFTEFLIQAKTESEQLHADFREILRIKLIENLVGVTINAQRQFEYDDDGNQYPYYYQNEANEVIQQQQEPQQQLELQQQIHFELKKPCSEV